MTESRQPASGATLGIRRHGASRRALLIGLALTPLLGASPSRADPAAVGLIDAFHAELLAIMRNAVALGFEGRARAIAPAVARTFDYDTMTRVASGSAWAEMSATQQAELIAAFEAYGVANYAANFDGFNGESFRTLGAEASRGDRLLVRTELVRAPGRGAPIAIDYLVHPTAEGWRAIDVVVDGKLSELARRRSEFAGILRNGGAPALLETLTAQTEALGA